jgi:hypothetical protein
MGAERAGDPRGERVGRSIVPARGWLTGDTCEDTRFITADGMEYAIGLRAVGRSGQCRT